MTREEAISNMSHDEMIDTLKGLVFGSFDRTTVKEREALNMAIQALESDYKAAFQIACALLNGDTLYGMDAESIFSEIMKKDGCVCSLDYENYILTHLNELRDDKALSQEQKIQAIVVEWQSDTWTDNFSYECMRKIADIVAESEE